MPMCGAIALALFIARAPRPWAAPAVRRVFFGPRRIRAARPSFCRNRIISRSNASTRRDWAWRISRLGLVLLGGERGLFAGLDLRAPVREVGAIQPFPAQQRTHLPRHLAGVGLPHDAALIRRRELPTLGQRGHLGIGRTADRDLHCIDFEQRLYLLVHDLHLSTLN